MAYVPPFNLDPYVIVRAPDTVPLLFKRGVVDVIERAKTGSLHDKMVSAFNIIAFSLTNSKRIKRGTLTLTSVGIKRTTVITHDRAEIRASEQKMEKLRRWIDQLKKTYPGRYEQSWWDEREKRDE